MRKQALLTGNIYTLFAKYCITGVLGMMGISFYILADTFFIANGVGAMGITALNIILPLYALVFGIGQLLGIGGATYAALESGRGSTEKNSEIYSFCLMAGAGLGLLFAGLGLLFPEPILAALGATAEIMPTALEYYRVIILFAPIFILDNIFLAFTRNDHQPKLAMTSRLCGSLFNIVMDYVLIYPMGLGMFGAALATAISPIIGIFIMGRHIFSKKCTYRFHLSQLEFSFVRPIVAGGSGSFVTEMAAGIVIFTFNSVLLPLGGNLYVAAYGIIANISMVINSVFTGIGQAMQPIISVNYGAGQKKRVMQVAKIGICTAIIFGMSAYLLCRVYASQMVAMFNGENSIALAELTQRGLLRYSLVYLPMGVCIVLSLFFQAVLCVKYALTVSLLRGVLLVVPIVYALSALLQLDGVWIAPVTAESIAAVVAVFLMVRFKQKDKKYSLEEAV